MPVTQTRSDEIITISKVRLVQAGLSYYQVWLLKIQLSTSLTKTKDLVGGKILFMKAYFNVSTRVNSQKQICIYFLIGMFCSVLISMHVPLTKWLKEIFKKRFRKTYNSLHSEVFIKTPFPDFSVCQQSFELHSMVPSHSLILFFCQTVSITKTNEKKVQRISFIK